MTRLTYCVPASAAEPSTDSSSSLRPPQSVALPLLYRKVIIPGSKIAALFRSLRSRPERVPLISHLSVSNHSTGLLVRKASLLHWPNVKRLGPLRIQEASPRYLKLFLEHVPVLDTISLYFTGPATSTLLAQWPDQFRCLSKLSIYGPQAGWTFTKLSPSRRPVQLQSFHLDGFFYHQPARPEDSFLSEYRSSLRSLQCRVPPGANVEIHLASLDFPQLAALHLYFPITFTPSPLIIDRLRQMTTVVALHASFLNYWRTSNYNVGSDADGPEADGVKSLQDIVSAAGADGGAPLPSLALIRLVDCSGPKTLQHWVGLEPAGEPRLRVFFDACRVRGIEVCDRHGATLSMHPATGQSSCNLMESPC